MLLAGIFRYLKKRWLLEFWVLVIGVLEKPWEIRGGWGWRMDGCVWDQIMGTRGGRYQQGAEIVKTGFYRGCEENGYVRDDGIFMDALAHLPQREEFA